MRVMCTHCGQCEQWGHGRSVNIVHSVRNGYTANSVYSANNVRNCEQCIQWVHCVLCEQLCAVLAVAHWVMRQRVSTVRFTPRYWSCFFTVPLTSTVAVPSTGMMLLTGFEANHTRMLPSMVVNS